MFCSVPFEAGDAPGSPPPPQPPRPWHAVFYGWMITAAATIGFAMTIPGQTVGVSLFIDSFIDDLDIARTTVSWLYMVATLLAAAFLPAYGRWLDRVGPRRAVVAVTVLFGAACFWMGATGGAIMLFVGFTLLRFCGPGSLSLTSIHAVNLWFERRRGTAIGFMGVDLALATAVIPPLIDVLIAWQGWRGAFTIMGGLLLAIMLPVGALFFREAPEHYGLHPDGGNGDGTTFRKESLTLKEARCTPLFWLFTLGGVVVVGIGTGLLFHHFSIMEVNGLSRGAATALFVPLGVFTAVSYLSTGWLVDRFSPRLLLGILLILFASVTAFAGQVQHPAMVWIYGTAFGISQGMQGTVSGSAYAHYFGHLHHGAIRGFACTVFVAGTALGPPVVAFGPVLLGDYALLLLILSLPPLALGVIALLYRRETVSG